MDVGEAEVAAREHARRLVGRDERVRDDLAPGAVLEPPDLLDRLLAGGLRGFELVAHARIGAYHLFKTKYLGPATVVVQARWVPVPGRGWRMAEAEIARVGPGNEGCSAAS